MIDNLSIAVHAFARYIFRSLLVDEKLPPRCVNRSTNFRGLPLAAKEKRTDYETYRYRLTCEIQSRAF